MSDKFSKNNPINDFVKNIYNMKEDFASNILLVLIILTIILALCYYFYMSNLSSKECSYMDNIFGTVDGKIKSLNPNDPNCNYTLKDYYIKTAYNCCSGGSYKNDFVNTCILKDVLKQGIRGLDFEIYSINDNPVVATSSVDNYFIKETYNSVPFIDVMRIVTSYAFSGTNAPNPNDPIIFHLRIKSSNPKMYENLANIFKNYEGFFLGPEHSFENKGYNIGDMNILDLSKKIILIVDKMNSNFMDNKDFYEFVNMTSNSIFMRALNYYDVKNTQDIAELQNYNKKNMTIAMPDKGQYPVNPSSVVCRETGCQMIAMCYQTNDVNLQENNIFFDNSGYAFVLKPENLRYVPVTIPAPTPQNPAVSYQTRTVTSDYYNFNM